MEADHVSIADALFTKTQQRVLGLLYGNPDSSFFLREIIRIADVGRGSVARELNKLCSAGLVTVTPKGNQNHYQANSGSPIYEELHAIAIKTFGIADVLKEALGDLLPDMSFAFIYGSVARGEEHAGSDIDVMIVADDLAYADVLARLDATEERLRRTINPTIYSFDEFNRRKQSDQSFIKRVMEQPRIWLKED